MKKSLPPQKQAFFDLLHKACTTEITKSQRRKPKKTSGYNKKRAKTLFMKTKWRNINQGLGFSARLNLSTGEIKFKDISHQICIKRKIKDLKEVWAESIPRKLKNKTIHRIYRYIGDSSLFKKANLKLDITVILPGSLAGEFIKTTGHHHLPLRKHLIASPDFYQLVFGKGAILIQKERGRKVTPYVIYPKPLEPVFIPPEYAHTTINTGSLPLVFQNICIRTPHLDYRSILKRKGMAYFVKKRGQFLLNPHYPKNGYKVERIRKISISLTKNFPKKPFYKLLQTNLSQLKFLTQPKKQKYTIRKF